MYILFWNQLDTQEAKTKLPIEKTRLEKSMRFVDLDENTNKKRSIEWLPDTGMGKHGVLFLW